MTHSLWLFFPVCFLILQILGGGFKYLLFSTLLGAMVDFDYYFSDGLKPPSRIGCWKILKRGNRDSDDGKDGRLPRTSWQTWTHIITWPRQRFGFAGSFVFFLGFPWWNVFFQLTELQAVSSSVVSIHSRKGELNHLRKNCWEKSYFFEYFSNVQHLQVRKPLPGGFPNKNPPKNLPKFHSSPLQSCLPNRKGACLPTTIFPGRKC